MLITVQDVHVFWRANVLGVKAEIGTKYNATTRGRCWMRLSVVLMDNGQPVGVTRSNPFLLLSDWKVMNMSFNNPQVHTTSTCLLFC